MKTSRLAEILFVLSGICSIAQAGTIEKTQLKTSRGALVQVEVNVPSGLTGKVPAVILAPGQGYNMDLPILAESANALSGQGLIVYRFNYNYYTTDPVNGQPSSDLSNEVQDMQTVIAAAKADARVDQSRLVFGGKSLGSVVSFQVFSKDTSAQGLILLTPLCTSSYDDNGNPLPKPSPAASEAYPGLTAMSKPIAMILGNADPNCSLPMLYDFLKATSGNVTVDVIGGNHDWEVAQGTDTSSSARNEANLKTGVALVEQWVALILGI